MELTVIEQQLAEEQKIKDTLSDTDVFYPDYQVKIFLGSDEDNVFIEEHSNIQEAIDAIEQVRMLGYIIRLDDKKFNDKPVDIKEFTNYEECVVFIDVEYWVNREHHSFGEIELPSTKFSKTLGIFE